MQVYAQRLVGTHKKLQQADTEPFQVNFACLQTFDFLQAETKPFHVNFFAWNLTNQTCVTV